MGLLREREPNCLLLACSALHSRGFEADYYSLCRSTVYENGLDNNVALLTQVLPEPVIMAILQAADVIVLPYKNSPEGTSAAAKFCLGAGRPMVVSSEPLFDNYRECAITLQAVTPSDIANAVLSVSENPDRARDLSLKAAGCAADNSWTKMGPQYTEVVRKLVD